MTTPPETIHREHDAPTRPALPSSRVQSIVRALLPGFGIALGYVLTAKCALLLTIPPGHTSLIWPASAVALAGILLYGYKYLPAVFLGSLLINIHIALSNDETLIWGRALLIPPLIACGASLQAAISARLLKRRLTFPSSLENMSEMAVLLALGGPVGCLINSIWAPSILYLLGALPSSKVLPTVMTWWVGDVLGVVCFTPLLLLNFGPAFRQQRVRKFVVSAVQLGIFLLVLCAVGILKETEQNRRQAAFDHAVASLSAHLQESIQDHKHALMAVSAFFDASDQVNAEEFTEFTKEFFHHYPGLYGLSWTPKVAHAERAEFEAAVRATGEADYFIKDVRSPGELVRAADRPVYFPATYMAPMSRNRVALGLDAYAIPERRAAMIRSERSGEPASTGALSILQATDQPGMLAYLPIFRPTQQLSHNKILIGYVGAIFILSKMLESSALLATSSGLDLKIYDMTRGHTKSALFDMRKDRKTSRINPEAQFERLEIDMFGSKWSATISENAAALARNDNRPIWFSLIGGCLLSSLAGLFLLTVTGRTEAVQRLVQEKTDEVRAHARQLKAANHDLFRLAKEAEAANVAKSQFLASMSHEIRTPMNGLLGVIHLIEDGLPEDKQDLIKTAKQSADSLLVLINDILDFSKIEAGKMNLDEREFDMIELLEDAALLHTNACQRKNVNFYLQFSPRAARIAYGDPHRLKQVFSNLLGNAAKFTSHGSITFSCDYEEEPSGSRFIFGVRDTGIGINDAASAKLFESFTQADAGTTRKYGGSGLGLSICKQLVELMGGTLHVSSKENVGSHFYFYLPQYANRPFSANYHSDFLNNKRAVLALGDENTLTQIATWAEAWGATVSYLPVTSKDPDLSKLVGADLVVTDSPHFADRALEVSENQPQTLLVRPYLGEFDSGTVTRNIAILSYPLRISRLKRLLLKRQTQPNLSIGPRANLSEYNVLLVDDNRTNLLVAGAILKRSLNINPDIANGGKEALSMLGQRRYDLVLMDCMMPDVDGYQATAALRRGDAGEENRQVPVIALTANAMASDRLMCIEAGMSDYLTKPLSPQILEKILVRWAGQVHRTI